MAETERNVVVRTLTGESTTVSISPNRTIEDLKLLLKQIFLPAQNSPNFHLFFKGAKMSLGNRISSYTIENSNFIVLVPFTKKDGVQKQLQLSDQITEPPKSSSFADSAWSDLKQDLSFLSHTSQSKNIIDQNRNKFGEGSSNSNSNTMNMKRKRRSKIDGQDRYSNEALNSTLSRNNSNAVDKEGSKGAMKVLDSVNCLSDANTGNCLFSMNRCSEGTKSCLCPSWLKTTMNIFSSVNTLSGFLLMQGQDITRGCLKGVLKKFSESGCEFGIDYVERLSVLCPNVVRFGNKKSDAAKFGDAFVIVDSSTEVDGQFDLANNLRTAREWVPTSKIVNMIKKREVAFRENLWKAVKIFMGKSISGNRMDKLLSLEDLIPTKDSGTVSKKSEAKCAKRRCSVASGSHSVQTRCCDTNPLLPAEMVEHLRKGTGSHGQIVHVEEIVARTAVHVEIPSQLSETTRCALRRIGISKLYSHQAESIEASLSRKNVVVATMTSSGKSLCYNLPVLEALSQNLLSCALYLFPTKALAQDQLRALLVMTEGLDMGFNIGVYDGDTSEGNRMWLRDNARMLITNPDMLHMSILPFHAQFQRILSNLRFVIIDEAHAYKGAFGCNTALILRRLRRLCSHVYGSDPSFVFCTATSANPREHAMELANLPSVELIQNDGSPCGPKLFILWNPPLYLKTVPRNWSSSDTSKSTERGVISRRSSPIIEVSCLFAEMVQHGLRCIAFCKTRKLSELVLCYTREILQETAPDLVDSICAYRAGYVAQDRRRIESEFFAGKLRGVAATNALELGIDVGHIDATLHLGFPGSVSSLWQQAGRSGRRERPSLAVYVAFEGPLDQYFMKSPQKLFGSPIECCHIDAQNKQVLEQHLVCAALEHPLCLLYDEKYFGPSLQSVILRLTDNGYLSYHPTCDSPARIWSYIGREKRPSHAISIRAIETEKYKLIDKKRNEVLEEIEESKAFFQVYEGAVYMHQGKTYLVKILDLSAKIAFCQEADLKYYTKTRDYTDIHVIGGDMAYPAKISESQLSKTTSQAHTCKVTTTWFGFFRIQRGSNEIIDSVELSLPQYSYESQAVWIRVPQSIKKAVEIQGFSFRAGLHAASHALLNVVPLFIQCNSSDMATECANPHDTRYFPERILLYDQHPGGIGLSAQASDMKSQELLGAALELVTGGCCAVDAGCPNCVQTLSCHEYNEVLDKNAAITILKGVIEAEDTYFRRQSDSCDTSNTECQ
ncbi:Helicase [Macleaya cordata]|uniref:Helicase n=1 Tax=Macleaya cordata TaxID=56857 RepID=A0A200Q349_MACCD|nr:Helicase [Macleaya cordata]